eukprot:364985-Chlamydomonas_euryale.AAC.7
MLICHMTPVAMMQSWAHGHRQHNHDKAMDVPLPLTRTSHSATSCRATSAMGAAPCSAASRTPPTLRATRDAPVAAPTPVPTATSVSSIGWRQYALSRGALSFGATTHTHAATLVLRPSPSRTWQYSTSSASGGRPCRRPLTAPPPTLSPLLAACARVPQLGEVLKPGRWLSIVATCFEGSTAAAGIACWCCCVRHRQAGSICS